MSKLSLSIPVNPFHINQGFGASPEYYAKFHDRFGNPYKGHDGCDLMAVHGEPVYAALAGVATYSTDSAGGVGVTINSDEALDYDGGTCWWQMLHWHLVGTTDPAYPQPFIGSKHVEEGELIGYADNTGAPYESSGDHLHWSIKPCDKNYNLLFPANGFNGAIDQTPYLNGMYAKDLPKNKVILAAEIPLYQKILSLIGLEVSQRKTGV